MHHFPLFLDLDDRQVLVVGGDDRVLASAVPEGSRALSLNGGDASLLGRATEALSSVRAPGIDDTWTPERIAVATSWTAG